MRFIVVRSTLHHEGILTMSSITITDSNDQTYLTTDANGKALIALGY